MKVVHCKKEPYDVYIGRPSKWGNRYSHLPPEKVMAGTVQCDTRESAIICFEQEKMMEWHTAPQWFVDEYLRPIAGKVLGCWCAPKACHGDIWIKLCREAGLIE